ncbi:MAG: hypothetical protein ACK5LV_00425 [Lachnospirales bacterium]
MVSKATRRHYRVAKKDVDEQRGFVIPKGQVNWVLGIYIILIMISFAKGFILSKLLSKVLNN